MNVFTSMKKLFVTCMMLVASMSMMASTVAEVVAAGVQDNASTSGTVVGTYSRGFLISDGTAYILVYLGSDSGLAVGDVVTVSGSTSEYGGLLQFGSGSTFEKTGTAEFTQPEPEVLDGAALDAYLAAPAIKYVQYTGTLNISGYYYNVTVDGAATAVGSIQYAPEGLVDADLNGKKIVVTGYSIGFSGGKYVNTMGISVVAAENEGGDDEGDGDDVVVTEGNLVENASFEKWEGDKPANWTGVGHNATISKSSDAKSGSYSVEVAGTSSNKRLASQAYTLKAGTYTFTVNVKQAGDAAGMFRLGYVPIVGGSAGTYVYKTDAAAVSAEWTEASCEFTLTETTELALIVMNSKNGGGASILVDDVALTTTDGGIVGGNDEGEDEEEQKPVTGTIAEIIAAGAQASASTSGTVVATYARGFLISDGTGYILTYVGKDSGLAAGDVVTISGPTSLYGGLLQFGNASTFEKTGTAEFTLPEPEVLDAAAMDAFIAAPSIKYVQYTGTLAISGNYYNVNVAGTETAVGSIQYPVEGMVNADWNEKEITVTGFLIGVSSGKYLNTMAVSVVEGGTGIEAIGSDIAPVYFDITGKQITAPMRGLYIKKVGDKITKEFVR
ncbi:MAG: carbohydrate binding domain-containing protein [Bacteroidaceae bacterium]|nr:carbohydrate binding domain-containing protein [Bacteroidaceae bacterium]